MAETNNTVPVTHTVEGTPKAPQQKQSKEDTAAADASIAAAKLAAAQAELVELELQEKRLSLRVKQAELVDMEERLAERELKRANIKAEAYTKGATMAANDAVKGKHQKRCNHKKGGNGAAGIVGGKGDSPDYALLVHTFANGDTWVKCLRCHKTWKPPVPSDYESKELFAIADAQYRLALEFPTKNTPSGGVQFRYSDGGAYYREQTKQVQMG